MTGAFSATAASGDPAGVGDTDCAQDCVLGQADETVPITSIDLTPEITAKTAVDFLVRRIEGDVESLPPVIENVLRPRQSTNRTPIG